MMGFFSRLVVSSRTEEQAEITRMKRLVSDMLRTAFPTLQEIVPSADAIGSSSGTINAHGAHGESKDSGSGTKTMSGKGRTKFLSRFKTSSNPKPETITTTPIVSCPFFSPHSPFSPSHSFT
jgi:hypothetical protein